MSRSILEELEELLEFFKKEVERLSKSIKEGFDYYFVGTSLLQYGKISKTTKMRYRRERKWNKERIKSIKKDIKEGRYQK